MTQMGEQAAEMVVESFLARVSLSDRAVYETLLQYAALPFVITPELLNFLRNYFCREAPWVAEVDILLAQTICEVSGYEQYVMNTEVRAYLLKRAAANPALRLHEAARLLWRYVNHLSQTLSDREYEAQSWAAMLFLDDHRDQAVRDLVGRIQDIANRVGIAGEKGTYDGRMEMERLLALISALAPQIAQYPDLLTFARLAAQELAETQPVSTAQTQTFTVAGVPLPPLGQIAALRRPAVPSPQPQPPQKAAYAADLDTEESIKGLIRLFSEPDMPMLSVYGDHTEGDQLTPIDAVVQQGEQAISPLIDALDNENPLVRERAAQALGRIPHVNVLNALYGLLQDDEEVLSVRIAARDSLLALRDRFRGDEVRRTVDSLVKRIRLDAPVQKARQAVEPEDQTEPYVFISYPRKDRWVAEALQKAFIGEGIRLWIDNEGLTPGVEQWQQMIFRSIHKCSAVVVVLSPDGLKSEWVKAEVDAAREANIPIILVVPEGMPLSIGFSDAQMIPYSNHLSDMTTRVIAEIRKLPAFQKETPPELKPDTDNPTIFISYRTNHRDLAYRIRDRLARRYERSSVFMDAATLSQSADFAAMIRDQISRSDVVLVVIERDWSERITDPNDVVRLEIEHAFRLEKQIIPILVNDAKIPASDELPESIRRLIYINALILHSENFDSGMDRLVRSIDQLTAEQRPEKPPTPVRKGAKAAPKRKENTYDVFISYSAKDRELAQGIFEALKRVNLFVWMDSLLASGDEWATTVNNAIQSSRYMLFIITPDSINSTVCERELLRAQEDGTPILPVMIERLQKQVEASITNESRQTWITLQNIQWFMYRDNPGALAREIQQVLARQDDQPSDVRSAQPLPPQSAEYTPQTSRGETSQPSAGIGRYVTVTVNADVLNVRSAPNPLSRRILQMRRGETHLAVGRNKQTTWIQVNFGAQRGWVDVRYIKADGDVNSLPIIDLTAG